MLSLQAWMTWQTLTHPDWNSKTSVTKDYYCWAETLTGRQPCPPPCLCPCHWLLFSCYRGCAWCTSGGRNDAGRSSWHPPPPEAAAALPGPGPPPSPTQGRWTGILLRQGSTDTQERGERKTSLASLGFYCSTHSFVKWGQNRYRRTYRQDSLYPGTEPTTFSHTYIPKMAQRSKDSLLEHPDNPRNLQSRVSFADRLDYYWDSTKPPPGKYRISTGN